MIDILTGCIIEYLLLHSPDYQPIELAFSVIKSHLRHCGLSFFTYKSHYYKLYKACEEITLEMTWGFFRHTGYIWLSSMVQIVHNYQLSKWRVIKQVSSMLIMSCDIMLPAELHITNRGQLSNQQFYFTLKIRIRSKVKNVRPSNLDVVKLLLDSIWELIPPTKVIQFQGWQRDTLAWGVDWRSMSRYSRC